MFGFDGWPEKNPGVDAGQLFLGAPQATGRRAGSGRVKSFLSRNWFVMSLPLVVLLAFLLPQVGATGGWLRTEVTTRMGVALIFLLQGLVLPTAALKQGASRWPLHLLVQGFTFVLFPLLGIGLDLLVGSRLPADLRLGFLFLCVLPSTVSTSVVLTGLAKGNAVGAIFNAALSNVIGVVLTPLWVAWLMKKGGGGPDLGGVVKEIVILLLMPLAVGQALRWWVSGWADKNKKKMGNASSGLILFLVFAAFCNSVKGRFWSDVGGDVLAVAAVGVVLIFGMAVGAVEAILTVMALRDGVIPPTLNLRNLDPEIDLDVVAGEPRTGDFRYAVNNSFGFGGHNVAIAFGKY
jgi:sodium/bile acid cotransporter 7